MNTIATNIRFEKEEYQELKLLAFSQGKSTAALIREAISQYKKHSLRNKVKISLAEKLRKLSVKIDVPVLTLVHDDRKF